MPACRFGQFVFDADAGALTREGVPVRLPPQPARVLTLLIARAGEVVSREQLHQQIWGGDTFVDFERGLNFAIGQIRSALGDSAESPRFIETLPKRGYRFIAPVTAAAVGPTAALPSTPYHPPRRLALVGVAAVAVALVGVAMLALPSRARAPIRIAVVPFDNETGTTEYDRIAGGVADATVARLATAERMPQVSVIGNAAVLNRPRAFRDLKAIGQQLNADYVVLAQVKGEPTRVRLIAHLIRVSDQAHVWANTFDRSSFGLDVQAELAEAIAAAVVQHAR
jgi:DNA-binding winged helix-turn-helix (wHTH) protein/TolB-like protein